VVSVTDPYGRILDLLDQMYSIPTGTFLIRPLSSNSRLRRDVALHSKFSGRTRREQGKL
jgi:Asp-tRNA(Asn)/Glu-tRNA(Gln) amidotransferase C subunit